MVVTANAEEPDARLAALDRLTALEHQLPLPGPELEPISLDGVGLEAIESAARYHTRPSQFMEWVETIRGSILDGDVMQVVPSQRMTVGFNSAPIFALSRAEKFEPLALYVFFRYGGFSNCGLFS